MTLARWQAHIVDENGDIVPSANIEVRREVSGQPLVQIFSDRDGNNALGNPFEADAEGFAAFHVVGGAYRVRVYTGPSGSPTFERIWRYVGIGLSSETDIIGLTPQGDWDSGETYSLGDLVNHNGRTFASNTGENLNNEPPDSEASDNFWTFIPATPGDPGSSRVVGTSTTSITLGLGEKTFELEEDEERGWGVGARLRVSSDSDPEQDWAEGVVTAYSVEYDQVTIDIDLVGPQAEDGYPIDDWTINLAGEQGATGSAGIDGVSQFLRVRVVDTEGLDPVYDYEAGDSVDGKVLAENDIVLRAEPQESDDNRELNGPYVVPAAGPASRHASFQNYDDLPGTGFRVMEGDEHENTLWFVDSNKGDGTIDSDPLVVNQFEGGGVSGPESSTDDHLAAFDGTDGDALKDAGFASSDVARLSQANTFTESLDVEVDGALSAHTLTAYRDSTFPTALIFRGARGSQASPSASQVNDNAFQMAARYWNGSEFSQAAVLVARLDDTDAGGNGHPSASWIFKTREDSASAGSQGDVRAVFAFDGEKYFPGISTTGDSANAVLDSGSSPAEQLLRSTSSLRYKKDIEPLEIQRGGDFLDRAKPIWFRSKGKFDVLPDGTLKTFYSFAAEDLAEIDPRLSRWGYLPEDYEQVKTGEFEEQTDEVIGEDENGNPIYRTVTVPVYDPQLKEDAVLKPDGINTNAVIAMLTSALQEERKARKALEGRVAALEG